MEATRATLDAVRSKMQKYRTTRKLLSVIDRPPKPQGAVQEDRQSLELQRALADAASRYGTAIEAAFEALLTALEALEFGGLREVDSAVPIADGLMKGLLESHAIAKNVVRSMTVPLEAHSAAISECFAGLAEAENHAAELRRYRDKVEVLAEESEHSEGDSKRERAEVRLARNRGKLQSAEKATRDVQALAEARLKACLAKRGSIDELVHAAILGSAEALRVSVAHVPAAGGKTPPGAGAAPAVPASSSRSPAGASTFPPPPSGCLNPFDTDILEPGHAQDSVGSRPPSRSNAGDIPFEEDNNPFDKDDNNPFGEDNNPFAEEEEQQKPSWEATTPRTQKPTTEPEGKG